MKCSYFLTDWLLISFFKFWWAGIKSLTSHKWPPGLSLPTPELWQLSQERTLGFGSEMASEDQARRSRTVSQTLHCYLETSHSVIKSRESSPGTAVTILKTKSSSLWLFLGGSDQELKWVSKQLLFFQRQVRKYLRPSSWKSGSRARGHTEAERSHRMTTHIPGTIFISEKPRIDPFVKRTLHKLLVCKPSTSVLFKAIVWHNGNRSRCLLLTIIGNSLMHRVCVVTDFILALHTLERHI